MAKMDLRALDMDAADFRNDAGCLSLAAARESLASPAAVLLATITAANVAAVDFTSLIDNTYKRYRIEVDNFLCATDIQIPMLRVSTDAGATWKSGATDYAWVATRNYSASGATGGDTSDSEIRLGGPGTSSNNFMSNVATEVGSMTVDIGDPSSGNMVPIFGQGAWVACGAGVGVSGMVFAGLYKTAGVINGIRFLMSSGNIVSGTFRLYGIN